MAYAINVKGIIPPQHPVSFPKVFRAADVTLTATPWFDLGRAFQWFASAKIKLKSLAGTTPTATFTLQFADDATGLNPLPAAKSVALDTVGTLNLSGWCDDPKGFVRVTLAITGTGVTAVYDAEIWVTEVV